MPDELEKTLEKPVTKELERQEQPAAVTTRQAPLAFEPTTEHPLQETAAPVLLTFEPTALHPLREAPPPPPLMQMVLAKRLTRRAVPAAVAEPKLIGQQLLGGLDMAERYKTRSDKERLGTKKTLLWAASNDLEHKKFAVLGKPIRSILNRIRNYSRINATAATVDKQKVESRLLFNIRQALDARFEALTGAIAQKTADGEDFKNEQTELGIINQYKTFFADVDGALAVPAAETQTEKLEDMTKYGLTGGTAVYSTAGKLIGVKDDGIKFSDEKNSPLFPHEPSLNDIRQGGLGDCYLLAGLSAIVNQNPQFIKQCMRDKGDGTVTIRLYSKEEVSGHDSPQTVTHFVTVKKLAPEKNKFARNCLWVQMIERAYAASGLHHKKEAKATAKPWVKTRVAAEADDAAEEVRRHLRAYTDIAGGSSNEFIFAMTGREAEETIWPVTEKRVAVNYAGIVQSVIAGQTSKKRIGFTEGILGIAHVETPAELQARLIADVEAYETAAAKKKREREEAKELKKAKSAYAAHERQMTEILAAVTSDFARIKLQHEVKGTLKKSGEATTYTESLTTQEEILELIKNIDYKSWPDSIGGDVEKEILLYNFAAATWDEASKQMYHGSFTGSYDEQANACYDSIAQGQTDGKIITASTYKFVPKDIIGADGKNAEHVRKGLAEGHAYTVLGVTETADKLRYVKLRNPWGTLVRTYMRNPDGNVVSEPDRKLTEGIFLMELNDFVSTFLRVMFNKAI